MNVLVYAVAAEYGGALSVLMDFYKKFKLQKENHYFFVVSTPKIDDCDNITVLRFPEIKKGWLYRLAFEYLRAPRLVKKYKIDQVFSTTNTVLPNVNIEQILYLHQPLPFVPYRFKWRENRLFWIYQNIIGKMIVHSVCKADHVIVQTKWIKEAAIRICGVKEDKFTIEAPVVDETMVHHYHKGNIPTTFFYPASAYSYKNHWLILKACKQLKKDRIGNYQVVFTLFGNENAYASELKAFVEENALPVQFIGQISREEVFQRYSQSVLLFPSYIETFGMPLLEARLSGAPILAADMPFSREILDGYEDADFFRFDNVKQLENTMLLHISK